MDTMKAVAAQTKGHLRTKWTLLESEIRRPDISLEAVKLLVGNDNVPGSVQEVHHLRKVAARSPYNVFHVRWARGQVGI